MFSASHPTRTVVIVDDEPFIRVVLTDLFEDAGFAVREASTAAEAMLILRDEASCDAPLREDDLKLLEQ